MSRRLRRDVLSGGVTHSLGNLHMGDPSRVTDVACTTPLWPYSLALGPVPPGTWFKGNCGRVKSMHPECFLTGSKAPRCADRKAQHVTAVTGAEQAVSSWNLQGLEETPFN